MNGRSMGIKAKTAKLWHTSETILPLLTDFGNKFIGKELEEKLETRSGIYREAMFCTYLLGPNNKCYLNTTLLFVIPNDEVLFTKLTISVGFLVGKGFLLATCRYELTELRCICSWKK
ncbi:hypothetical protein K502DRAFT_350321 [Neoconidiobolus thromboides FSU 785]|nr:hypothetical protein K502DRAFT_350321 [Neoconidiobolus thromboides FSU 785]